MSEEEIIEIITDIIRDKPSIIIESSIEAIQGLLDLYKKEKEKNKELKDENMKMAVYGGSIEAKLYIEEYYILKSKVKEKIDKIQELQINYVDGIIFDNIILELEELLEGGE